jgi:hypothetical protein
MQPEPHCPLCELMTILAKECNECLQIHLEVQRVMEQHGTQISPDKITINSKIAETLLYHLERAIDRMGEKLKQVYLLCEEKKVDIPEACKVMAQGMKLSREFVADSRASIFCH